VFTSLIQDTKSAAGNFAKLACFAGLTGLLAVTAIFFLTLAAFIWAEDEYGVVAAALGLGVFFLAMALANFSLAVWLRRHRLSRRREPTQQMQKQARHDPLAVAGSIELLRLMGERNVFPAVALGSVIVSALQMRRRNTSKT
jgi:hypothetical protein